MFNQNQKRSLCLVCLLCAVMLSIFEGLRRMPHTGWSPYIYLEELTFGGTYKLENRSVDGPSDWKLEESKRLGDLVQRRLHSLQNPKNCTTAKKVLCKFRKGGHGYGSQLHDLGFCLIVAYATRRTLILEPGRWNYAEDWETLFLPLSDSCTSTKGQTIVRKQDLRGAIGDIEVLELFYLPKTHKWDYLPLAYPDDLADRITRFHGFPSVWWIGQIMTYLARPNQRLQHFLYESMMKLDLHRPIVGVHVRRTDKLLLGFKYLHLEKYMIEVENWFIIYEKRYPDTQRKVYLASDDPGVLSEAIRNYPKYTFVSDTTASKLAQHQKTRYTLESLQDILLDIHILSMCDYVICTMSSNVCRLVYELMQVHNGDGSGLLKSLDKKYIFNGDNDNKVRRVKMPTYSEVQEQ